MKPVAQQLLGAHVEQLEVPAHGGAGNVVGLALAHAAVDVGRRDAVGACRASTWSFIRAMRGDTTTQVPALTTAGIWKHTDLPPPVGMSTTVSLPAEDVLDNVALHGAEVVVAVVPFQGLLGGLQLRGGG